MQTNHDELRLSRVSNTAQLLNGIRGKESMHARHLSDGVLLGIHGRSAR